MSLASRLFDWRGLKFDKRYENPRLLDFIRKQPCLVHKNRKSTVSHSVGKGRGGNKATDALGLPLCMDCHKEFEHTEFEVFEARHGVDLFRELIKLHEAYFDYCETLIDSPVPVVPVRKQYKSTRKPSLAPLNKACNTPNDYSKTQKP